MHLLMVGEGEQKEAALELVKKEGGREHITFLPFRQDVPDILAAGDIFVLPSLWEGLPIGLLEAMSMGKAIIASCVDGTSEIIKDNENGLLVEPGNAAELSCSLLKLSMDEQIRLRLQKNALRTVKEKFNAEDMTRQIENIYKNVLHGI
jgi:glycosyltransferase involved in cell wall biosynthesis